VGGNIDVDVATENARRIVGLAWPQDRRPPIYRGFGGGEETAEEVHGIDGIGGAANALGVDGLPLYPPSAPLEPEDAVEAILSRVQQRPGEITLITLGPLTNIAHALWQAPEVMRGIREIVIMGGVFREAGNTGPVAEFNIFVDPAAAQVVCDSGLPMRWVPLDATHRCKLTRDDLEALPFNRRTGFMRDALPWYMDYHHEGFGEHAAFLHDPLAVGAVLWPELLQWTPLRVDVETEGRLTRGMTVADFRPVAHREDAPPPNAQVALEVDSAAFLRRFLDRVSS
jgi:purine nucleosidase